MKASMSLALVVLACCVTGLAHAQPAYRVEELPGLGGTNARANSVNDFNLAAGWAMQPGNTVRHATAWWFGRALDLGTLGDPATSNSAVAWPVKNLGGRIVGISQTDTPDPNGELWSCFYFFSGPHANNGKTCLGFVWERGHMRPLAPLPGGNNSFAAGGNNLGLVAGWAENGVVDPSCVAPQKLQFKPVLWGPGHRGPRALPLPQGDSSGAATALNDRGQVVGIAGICDMAVGRRSARHAVLWENGQARTLEGFDAEYWNTPMAINRRGDVVGFMGTAGDLDGNRLRAFVWTPEAGRAVEIAPLPGHAYAEAHAINDDREVVGTSCSADFSDCRAFYWADGTTHDISRQSGYAGVLINGQDINDAGVISGRALDPATGQRRAFLATPVAP